MFSRVSMDPLTEESEHSEMRVLRLTTSLRTEIYLSYWRRN